MTYVANEDFDIYYRFVLTIALKIADWKNEIFIASSATNEKINKIIVDNETTNENVNIIIVDNKITNEDNKIIAFDTISKKKKQILLISLL